MAKLAGRYLRVYLEDEGGTLQDVSAWIQSVDIPDEYLELDTTGLSEGVENSIPGLPGMPVEITGMFSPASGSLYDVVSGIAGKVGAYSFRVQVGQNAAPVLGDPEFGGEFWCSKVSFAVGAKGANMMTASLRVYGETAPTWDEVMVWVSSVSGDDGNSGLARELAKATIAGGEAVWAAGATMMLEKGSEWRELLTPPGNNCTITAYGTGEAPILNASDIITAGGFTKTGGYTNVYQATITPSWTGNDFLNAFEDDAYLTRQTSIANVDANPGSCYPSAATGTITLYIHASDSSSPIVNGKVYEFTARKAGFYGYSVTGTTITGIHCKRGLDKSGCLQVGIDSAAVDCDATQGGVHCIYVREGGSLTRCTATDCYNGGSAASLIVGYDAAPTKNISFTDCIAQMTTLDANVGGFLAHCSSPNKWTLVTWTGCSAINCGAYAVIAQDAVSGVVNDFTATDCTYITRPSYVTTMAFDGLTIVGNITNILSITAGDGSVISYNDIDMTGVTANNTVCFTYGDRDVTLTVTNSNFSPASYAGTNRIIISQGATNNETFTGNTYGPSWSQIYYLQPLGTFASDYNAFADNTESFNWNGTVYVTVGMWQAGSLQDANSTVG
jgi:hypothetical protein